MTVLLYLVLALALALATIVVTAVAYRLRAVWTNRVPLAAAVLYVALGIVAAVTAPAWPAAYLGAGVANLLAASCLIGMASVTTVVKHHSSIKLSGFAILASLLFGLVMTVAGVGGWLYGMGVR